MCVQAVPCSVPAFLQAWQGQVLLAGLHLRVLHCMPAPLDRLATGLADIAAAERISIIEESPAEPLTGKPTSSLTSSHNLQHHNCRNGMISCPGTRKGVLTG